jgi:hypothetical protein
MTPVRATVPNVGRKAVTPHLAAGYVMDPAVSEPIVNGTIPIAVQKVVVRASGVYPNLCFRYTSLLN